MSRFAQVVILALLLPLGVSAQVGGIRGVVMDADFEVPLPGVKVRISETGQEAETGDTGSYYLEGVAPGQYTLLFSKNGYTRFTRSEVVVSPGQLADVEASMAGEYEEMDELVVRDIQLGGASEIGLLNLRMESSALMDSVGADLMSQAGASDAAQALTLVPGTTVQDGKYAVVRGLPDRYVSSQMNGVRLPTADPDKRAVQLDQFPAAMIESIQVSKTFTPDQQSDASGGAVDVVLKGLPDKFILKGSAGFEVNTQVMEAGDDFLTYEGGGVPTWGNDADNRRPQTNGEQWDGAVGVSRGEAPYSYKLGATAGDRFTFDSGISVGALGSFFYKRDASYYEGGVNDRLRVLKTDFTTMELDDKMTPTYSGRDPTIEGEQSFTYLFDETKASEEVQWGALGALGIESENHALTLLYNLTVSAEDEAILQENTRGKEYFFPGHDPNDQTSPGFGDGDYIFGSPYSRNETIQYTERSAETLQLRGDHTLPFPEWELGSVYRALEPELSWTIADSVSTLKSPDRRLFGTYWTPYYADRRERPATHYQTLGGDAGTKGSLNRFWEDVEETSDQFFIDLTLPYEQWSDEEGFFKLGLFDDEVKRTYEQDIFNNVSASPNYYQGEWLDLWSAHFPTQTSPFENTFSDTLLGVDYKGEQDISAWYWMADVPLSSMLTVIGGYRYEAYDVATEVYPDSGDALIYLPQYNYAPVKFSEERAVNPEAGNADQSYDLMLPSLGVEITPFEKITFRASYTETIARQTFNELTPIKQQKYLGGDVFVGNPNLTISELKNYDLRLDYNPYPGGLLSFSWFYKDITDPIEYKTIPIPGGGVTAVNYDSGIMNGYEAEFRQALGQWWSGLEGLSVGANFTLIDSEVELPVEEQNEWISNLNMTRTSRAMYNAPEYLYNLNATYTIARTGTELGLFYTFKGETLIAGATPGGDGLYPDEYEDERGILNFSLSQKLGDHLKLSFKAKNITDTEIREFYRSQVGDVTKTSYKAGVDFSLGVSATW